MPKQATRRISKAGQRKARTVGRSNRSPGRFYRSLPSDERQEFRLPALLKEHLCLIAAETGQTVAEYIVDALATRVTEDFARLAEWDLSIEEQAALVKILLRPAEVKSRAKAAARRADALFGPLPTNPR